MFDKIQSILMMKTNLAIELLCHTIAIKLIAKPLNISALNLNLKFEVEMYWNSSTINFICNSIILQYM